MKKAIRLLLLVLCVGLVYFLYAGQSQDRDVGQINTNAPHVPDINIGNDVRVSTEPVTNGTPHIVNGVEVIDDIQIVEQVIPAPTEITSILQDVPFTSQAPFGDWNDQRQQDGCEEASVLMAMKWINGNPLSNEEALQEIHAIAAFELETYGSYRDTNAEDTASRLINEYYGYEYYEVLHDATRDSIINALMQDSIVLAPMDGQALQNPNFTPPGPEYHMLLIRGYDAETDEFITNDPGTRHGEKYRYAASVLYDAIRDYPTGDHLPISGRNKAIIVIKKWQ